MLRLFRALSQWEERSPKRLLIFLLRHALIGSLLGAATAGLLIATNAGGLGDLIGNSASPILPVFLLMFGFATLMGGVITASAVMSVPWDGE